MMGGGGVGALKLLHVAHGRQGITVRHWMVEEKLIYVFSIYTCKIQHMLINIKNYMPAVYMF